MNLRALRSRSSRQQSWFPTDQGAPAAEARPKRSLVATAGDSSSVSGSGRRDHLHPDQPGRQPGLTQANRPPLNPKRVTSKAWSAFEKSALGSSNVRPSYRKCGAGYEGAAPGWRQDPRVALPLMAILELFWRISSTLPS